MSKVRACALALLLVAPVASGAAADDENTGQSLRGLPGVAVIIDGMIADDEARGFYMGTYQTDVVLKLRMAGINVLTQDEMRATKARAG